MNQIAQVAPLESQVLILGETGVGKEVVANAIQRRSRRADKAFVSINCGAIPETLLDSELFGYEKGAFTGAASLKQGYFEQADEGTIFLDEIGELSPHAQVKLLRLLQGMPFQRVGGRRMISVNVRVIAATNRDLQAEAKENKFRRDLWFRLSVFPIHIPPLRKRKEDIPALADYFASRKSAEMNLTFAPVFAREAMQQLQDYDWPGNVRELQNVLERALILSQGKPLAFPNLKATTAGTKDEAIDKESGEVWSLDEVVARHIQKCLTATGGQVAGPGGAAELLGLPPSTLRAKMRKFGIHIKHRPVRNMIS
jgi:transcriptional regulator with GAF, ATPase, and Fis domain